MAHCFEIFVWLAITVAVVVTINGQATQERAANATGDWPIASYIRRPKCKEEKGTGEAFDWIMEASEELESMEAEDVLKYLKRIEIETYQQVASIKYKGNIVYAYALSQNLLDLANNESRPSRYTVDYFVKLLEHVYGSLDVMSHPTAPNHHVALFNYLQHYGKQKFQSLLAGKLNGDYQHIMNRIRPLLEETFDKLIASQDQEMSKNNNNNNNNNYDDKQLAQIARKIDLIGGEFDAKSMLQVAKADKIIWNHRRGAPNTLITYLDLYCSHLLDAFTGVLNIVNMNRLLNPTSVQGANLPDKLIKFNEYGRMCHQLDHQTSESRRRRQQVLENIDKGLEGALSKMFKRIVNCNRD